MNFREGRLFEKTLRNIRRVRNEVVLRSWRVGWTRGAQRPVPASCGTAGPGQAAMPQWRGELSSPWPGTSRQGPGSDTSSAGRSGTAAR